MVSLSNKTVRRAHRGWGLAGAAALCVLQAVACGRVGFEAVEPGALADADGGLTGGGGAGSSFGGASPGDAGTGGIAPTGGAGGAPTGGGVGGSTGGSGGDAGGAGGGLGRGDGELGGSGGSSMEGGSGGSAGGGAAGSAPGGNGGTLTGGGGGTAMGGGGGIAGGGGTSSGGSGGGAGSGGAVSGGAGGALSGGSGGTAGSGGAPPEMSAFLGLWAGQSRGGSDTYNIEVGLAAGVPGSRIGIFYIPAPYNCGGTTRLESVGTSLVYQEVLLFGTLASCIGAGRATVTPVGPDRLDYTWEEPIRKRTHRGALDRRPRAGQALPNGWLGLWFGTLAQANPSALREVYLVLNQAGPGQAVAHVIYPSENNWCGGTFELSSISADGANLIERLTSTGQGCPPDGRVLLATSGQNLSFTWTRPGSLTSATGTLVRIE